MRSRSPRPAGRSPALVKLLLPLLLAAVALGPAAAAGGVQSEARRFSTRDGDTAPLQTHAEAREFLATAEVVLIEELDSGTTRPRRITLERDGVTLRAVFRAVDLERQDLRSSDGAAYAEFFDRAISELAAYELALLLGIDMIPPTVARTIAGDAGTLQLWVENAMTETERTRAGIEPRDLRRWRRQHQVMRLFDALVHNSDRNTGNRLIDAEGHLWMIDHTRTFQRPRGRHRFERVSQLPRSLWDSLRSLEESAVREKVGPYIGHLQMASLLSRRKALVEYIEGLIETRGEAAVLVD